MASNNKSVVVVLELKDKLSNPMGKVVERIKKQTAAIQKNFEQVSKSNEKMGKDFQRNSSLMINKMEAMKSKVSSFSEKMDGMKNKFLGLSDKMNLTKEGFTGLSNKFTSFKNKMTGVNEKFDFFKNKMGAMFGNFGNIKSKFASFSQTSENLGNKFSGLFGKLGGFVAKKSLVSGTINSIGSSITDVLPKAISKAEEWNASLLNLNSTAKLDPSKLAQLGQEFLSIGKRVPVELNEIPRAFEQLVSSGMDVNAAKKSLEPVLMAAHLNKMKIEEVIVSLNSVMNATSNQNASQVLDIMQATKNKSKADFAEVATHLSRIMPIARSVGASLQDTAAQFAFLTNQGMKLEQATRAIQNIYQAMNNGSAKAGLSDMGIDVEQGGKLKPMVAIIEEIKQKTKGWSEELRNTQIDKLGLDPQASLAIKAMVADTKQLINATQAMQNPIGAMNQAYDSTHTVFDSLKIIGNAFGAAMIKIGNIFLDIKDSIRGVAESLLGFLQPPLDWLVANINDVQLVFEGLILAVSLFTIAMGLLNAQIVIQGIVTAIATTAQWALTAAQWALNIAMSANPLGMIIMGIALLIGALYVLYQKFDGFKAALAGIWAVIKSFFTNMIDGVVSLVSALLSPFRAIGKLFSGDFSGAWDEIKNGVSSLIDGVINVLPVTNVISHKDDYKNAYDGAYDEKLKEQKKAKEGEQNNSNEVTTNYSLQSLPSAQQGTSNTTDSSSTQHSTSAVTEGGGTAKSIVINIGKLASIELNTRIEKNTTNQDLERVINETLLKALRNIETSY